MRWRSIRLRYLEARGVTALSATFFDPLPLVAPAQFRPSADVYETDDDVVIELDVPGLHPENLTVESVNGQLVITGERQPPENATRRYRAERWSGRFVRSFALQPRFSGEEVRAEYTDGVLTVRLRKPEEVKPRRISISRERRQISKKSS
jgi:HSP20 family protein